MKEVRFDDYCVICKHHDKAENEDPCFDCLTIPARENSHKSEFFEKREDSEKSSQ